MLTRRGLREHSRALKTFCILMLTQARAFIKAHQLVPLKSANITVYKLYFNFFFNVKEGKNGQSILQALREHQKQRPADGSGGGGSESGPGEREREWQGPEGGSAGEGGEVGCQGNATLGAPGLLPPSPRPLLPCIPPVHSKWSG